MSHMRVAATVTVARRLIGGVISRPAGRGCRKPTTSQRGGSAHTGRSPTIMFPMKSVIVGTAGHIDHGKTALVKALTGIDADRLEEEKRRGITIDIGFAHLELPLPGGEFCASVLSMFLGTNVLSATCWPAWAESIWSCW